MQSSDPARTGATTRSTWWARAALGVGGSGFGLYWAIVLIDPAAPLMEQGRGLFTTLVYLLAVLAVQLVCILVAAILGQVRERLVALVFGALWLATLFLTWFGGLPVPGPG